MVYRRDKQMLIQIDKFRTAGEDNPTYLDSNDVSAYKANEIMVRNISLSHGMHCRISGQVGESKIYKFLPEKNGFKSWNREKRS